jgi:CBS domain-containing protein
MRQRTDSDLPGAESRVSNGQRQCGMDTPGLGLDKSDGMSAATTAPCTWACPKSAAAPDDLQACNPVSRRMNMQHLKDLMSRDVKVISPEMSIKDAARKMRDGDFGMMPVGEDDRMIGTISDRDIAVRAVAEGKDAGTRVREVMTEGIAWVYEDESVERAARIMSERQVRRLPVVDRDKRLVGIVALGDFAVESSELQPAAQALSEISKPA